MISEETITLQQRKRILVVDDDPSMCKLIRMTLARENYEVETRNDAESALELIEDWKPDLILLDIMMPGLDGISALKRFRQAMNTVNVPIILLTALGDIGNKTEGFTHGADDYIVKPFNPPELLLRVGAHIRRYHYSSENVRFQPAYAVRVPIVLHRQHSGLFRNSYQVSKRIFDLVTSIIALPFALVLMLIIALLIAIDSPGPIVFSQDRTGVNGRRFRMYKFRTMVRDAEEIKERYRDLNELSWPDFKITKDPRVTRMGRFLRKTSLDELPQLFNIIKGDMSLVGPRPTSFSAETYDLWQTERLEVRPGLTGLWQIAGRADIDFDERVEMDIDYIERQSWQLDLFILFRTVTAVLSGRGAH